MVMNSSEEIIMSIPYDDSLHNFGIFWFVIAMEGIIFPYDTKW